MANKMPINLNCLSVCKKKKIKNKKKGRMAAATRAATVTDSDAVSKFIPNSRK